MQFTLHARRLSWQPDTPLGRPKGCRLQATGCCRCLCPLTAFTHPTLSPILSFSHALCLCVCFGWFYFWRNFMYFYGRLPLPLGPENGNRKLLLIMLPTLCCTVYPSLSANPSRPLPLPTPQLLIWRCLLWARLVWLV